LKSALEQPAVQALREVLVSPSWTQQLPQLPGYHSEHSGDVRPLRHVLPWWQYRTTKAAPPDPA
jgi:putative molybdopterin biosynthesis protein